MPTRRVWRWRGLEDGERRSMSDGVVSVSCVIYKNKCNIIDLNSKAKLGMI